VVFCARPNPGKHKLKRTAPIKIFHFIARPKICCGFSMGVSSFLYVKVYFLHGFSRTADEALHQRCLINGRRPADSFQEDSERQVISVDDRGTAADSRYCSA